jgi:GT2 family glycosyltransferase
MDQGHVQGIDESASMNEKQPTVAVIVLTMNSARHVDECLGALLRSTYPNLAIWVVDNGSTDRTRELIQAFQPRVRLLPLENNVGFATGNNRGMETALAAGADFVMLLNDDTRIDPDCIDAMLTVFASDPDRIGMLSPVIAAYDQPARTYVGGKIDPATWGASETECPVEALPPCVDVQYASGCALMVPAAVIRQIGMLDEHLFMYYEDADWCLRCRKAGKRVVVATCGRVLHKGSGGGAAAKSLNAYYYYQRNWVRMVRKYAPRRQGSRLIRGFPFGLLRLPPPAPGSPPPDPDIGIALLEGWLAGVLGLKNKPRLRFPAFAKALLRRLARTA